MVEAVSDGAGHYVVHRDTLREFNAILQRDSKDTTYKFALLRALAEIAEQDDHFVTTHDASWVRVPIGLMVDRWLRYYYPLIEASLPQRNADGQLAFGEAFRELVSLYEGSGGFSAFWMDYAVRGRVPEAVTLTLLSLLRIMRRTIIGMPMKHLGYSISGSYYAVVRAVEGAVPRFAALGKARCGREAVITGLGDCLLRRDFHEVLRTLGGFATGTQALLMEWARFTSRASRRRVSVNQALEALMSVAVVERDVKSVQEVWSARLTSLNDIECVWSGRHVTPGHLVIDHAIPFSLWSCNALWNLLPALDKVNREKSDSIPSPELIRLRRESIKSAWRTVREAHGDAFDRDFVLSLGAMTSGEWEESGIEALTRKCRYLIGERGYQGWQPA